MAAAPLQLIRIDGEGKCHLQEQAAKLLNQIDGKIAIVGIAGLYRTGKSFLLNRLLGLQQAFEIGPSVNPCTKGLWIWGQPVQISQGFYAIFIDTEGLGSTQRTASCDMQIFTLCVLLSSNFIYNSMGAIDEMAVDDLHLVLNLAKHIHVRSGRRQGDSASNAELSQYLPTLLWVLRDFHLKLEDQAGRPITAIQYLENALRSLPGQDKQNGLRQMIKDLFRERDCMTIVRPVADEDDLKYVNQQPFESLRPEFRAQVDAFTRKVYASLKPKVLEGVPVSGPMFVSLATEYCKAMNNSAVPTIKSTWTYVVQTQLRKAMREAVRVYQAEMQERAIQWLPLADERLRGLHKDAKAEALKVFMAPNFSESDPAYKEFRTELSQRIKQLYEQVRTQNQMSSKSECQRCAAGLYSDLVEKKLKAKGTYKNVEELMSDWAHVKKVYVEQTQGPAQVEVLSNYIFPRITDSVQRLCADQRMGVARDKTPPPGARSSRGDRQCDFNALLTGIPQR